jgi:hypothetical protein
MSNNAAHSIYTSSHTRVFPSKHAVGAEPIVSPLKLSILDATVAAYTPIAGAWLFDSLSQPETFDDQSLRQSLVVTLDAYPQWAGQLGWAPYDPTGQSGHSRRFRRPQLVWGASTDPGVDFIVAK